MTRALSPTTLLFPGALVCSLLACGDKGEDSEDSAGHDHEESDTDTDTDADTDTDTDTDPNKAGFDGVVSYEDGTDANSAVRVQMCNTETCIPAFATTGGAFSFPGLPPDTYALDAVPLVGDDPGRVYATPLDIYIIGDDVLGTTISLPDPIVIYSWDKVGPLSTGPFAVGNLTISADATSFTPGEDGANDYLAGVQVDPATAGLPLQQLSGEVAMMWFLGPFRAEVGRWSFSVTNTGLAEGTVLRAYNSHYDGFAWIDLGTLTVGPDGAALPDGDVGIEHLTTLALVVVSR